MAVNHNRNTSIQHFTNALKVKFLRNLNAPIDGKKFTLISNADYDKNSFQMINVLLKDEKKNDKNKLISLINREDR